MIKRRPAYVDGATLSGLPIGQPELSAVRATMQSIIYGATDFATLLPDAIIRNHDTPASLPTGTDHMDRYACTNVGGRGATLYGWLLYPTVTPIGSLAVCYSAHGTSFNSAAMSMKNLPAAFLAVGYHVLCLDQPCRANNPSPGVLDGVSINEGHDFGAVLTEGSSSFWRIFLDVAFSGMNQAIVDLSPTSIVAAGLSGGGLDVTIMAALDTRIIGSYCIFGEYPGYCNTQSHSTDWEYSGSPAPFPAINASVDAGGFADVRHALAADTGRRNVAIWGDGDNVFSSTGKHVYIEWRTHRIQTMLAGNAIGSYDHHFDTAATTHEITSQTTAWILADIAAHT